ncbi:MAG: D-alanine--D-alanine ligase [Planctomycetes bacterium]|nr:D-alanine--D-alanine ligase [Planctomycetota bacterium]
MKTIDVAVLLGGFSSERDVSLRTGEAVARGLAARGHRVTKVDVRTDYGVELNSVKCDVAFLALHGRFGEDGGIQRILDARNVPYTGSDAESSRLAMDKIESKRLFRRAGLDTPQHRVIGSGDSVELLEQSARSLGYPVVIKPRAEGSSLGVTVHQDRATILDGAIEAFQFGSIALMEKFVAGREMTVGILDGRALPMIELKPRRAFFDYVAKYQDPETLYLVDPPLSDLDKRRIQKAALEAFDALGCEGMGRVDLIFTALHEIQVLEVNTIPGLTERSLLPKAARAAGIDFATLCDRILQTAFKRRRAFPGWAAAAML